MSLKLDEQVRIAHAAKRHFQDGRTRIQIAEELGCSRFKVARMLKDAIDRGIVRFSIESPDVVDIELSAELRKTFHFKRALAVMVPDDAAQTIQNNIGWAAAELLSEIVEEREVLGITSGRTLDAMSNQLKSISRCDIVQLTGVASASREAGIEISGRMQRISGGKSYGIVAPLLLPDIETAQALMRVPQIQQTVQQFERVSKAVVSIGSWDPPDSQLHENAALMGEAMKMREQGVQAEVCGTLLRHDGSVVEDLTQRTVSITTQQLRRVPEVIAVAGGATKARSIAAVLRSGLVDSLVTDAVTAKNLLENAALVSVFKRHA